MSLTHRWTLDGNANDSVGSLNGTVVGSPTTQTGHPAPNATTNCYGFAGNSADRIKVTNNAGLTSSNISLNVWCQLTSLSALSTIIGKFWDGTNRAYDLFFENTAQGFAFDVAGASSNTDHIAYTGLSGISTNTWYMVTGTFDGTTVKVYVNGTVGSTTAALSDTVRTNTADLIFGAQPRNPTPTSSFLSPMNGRISDVRMYNHALTQAEITALYAVPVDTKPFLTLMRR